MNIHAGSRARLGPRMLRYFQGVTLFDKIARVVCEADCLPRKELYESWEVARRTRRRFRGGRIVDLAAGHGLLAYVMLILDDTSPSAIAVDLRAPKSAQRLTDALCKEWPRLRDRVVFHEGAIAEVALTSEDLVVSAHACGALTDEVLTRATAVRARVAVLPCCHDTTTCDDGGLAGWMESGLAIDATRARKLVAAGYTVATQTIPHEITPKNRLLIASPTISIPEDSRNAVP
jgi:hypothetical protein